MRLETLTDFSTAMKTIIAVVAIIINSFITVTVYPAGIPTNAFLFVVSLNAAIAGVHIAKVGSGPITPPVVKDEPKENTT